MCLKEIKPPHKAQARIYVFPFEQLLVKGEDSLFEGHNVFIRRRAYCELQLELMQAGLSGNLVTLYTHLVWRAGPLLDRSIAISSIAKDLGRARQSVHRSVLTLEEIGIVRRPVQGSRITEWSFTIYAEIMTRVRHWAKLKNG